ncbi:MAG: HAMP domain-containing histidine kinase [Lachnospiraceae bacterium]|nr:HAMP domain-containing histidine kinase [Lachnospiraceae bacterium]
MKKEKRNDLGRVKEWRFAISLFAIYWGVLLLMSGIHMGLIVLVEELQWNDVVKSGIPMLYWGAVAIGLTMFTRQKIKNTYEDPLHKMAEAAKKVAEGNFSVYVPTIHTADKLDYLDVMILDFNKMVEELGSIETLKTDFISNVSHEMKTPISIIKNYAELLQAEQIPEETRIEYAATLEDTAARLSSLIGNILKLNKLENQRIMPETETYDVCRQLCECILQFEDAWEEKGIELETEIEDAAMVKADSSLMELVWNNLLGNAIKFTEAGGSVTVSQTSDESYIRVAVSDTGCGMSRESLQHIFDKFYQGDTSHSREGNGLGLALVKRVLELSDGDIQVVSEEGKGSTFTVTLPVADVRKVKGGVS